MILRRLCSKNLHHFQWVFYIVCAKIVPIHTVVECQSVKSFINKHRIKWTNKLCFKKVLHRWVVRSHPSNTLQISKDHLHMVWKYYVHRVDKPISIQIFHKKFLTCAHKDNMHVSVRVNVWIILTVCTKIKLSSFSGFSMLCAIVNSLKTNGDSINRMNIRWTLNSHIF